MSASGVVDRDAVAAAFDALDAAVDKVAALNFDSLTTHDRLVWLERCERVRRRLPAVEHPLINQLARQATPKGAGLQPVGCGGRVGADQPRRGLSAHPRGRRSG